MRRLLDSPDQTGMKQLRREWEILRPEGSEETVRLVVR